MENLKNLIEFYGGLFKDLNKVQNFIYVFTHVPYGCLGKTTEKLNSIFEKLSDSDK
jgi:hypothetical protein